MIHISNVSYHGIPTWFPLVTEGMMIELENE